ncbi:drug/metabolite transporter (DMT)-like permease [Paenibacillus shirakamiensis]|uniref:Drug/metabolite transporter (DMT)-like permease n=1 Tax=Paenibacillus shirakamiensis TaxID=1265935 RepID=A0ABS4JJL1_9BACL|nr:EamA family transporter [Paenibacillus shirakamiensis]MBP2001892.1 drug/metabolite transporter (DMT)-like permease [Paenibacillus shirakamiensis]
MDKMISYVYLLANILLLVTGQMLFKIGLSKNGGLQGIGQWAKLIFSPTILGGLALYGIATLLWFAVLNRLPLTVAYPMQSLAYVFAMVGAYFIFGEIITATKIAGVAVILVGVYLLAK